MSTRRPFEKHLNQTLIETGSYMGDGIQDALDAGFAHVISYEVVPALHLHCKIRFALDTRVAMHLKSSVHMWDELQHIDHPVTFWLDGHWSDGITGFDPNNFFPLPVELDIIAQHPIKTHTILIDDRRLMTSDSSHAYTEAQIHAKLRAINPAYEISYADGHVPADIIVAKVP